MALLDVRDLKLHYATPEGPLRAVDGVSFIIAEPGEAVGIVGESGSGKTSLASAIMRLLPTNVSCYEGQVLYKGTDLMKLSDEAFRRDIRSRTIALVAQGAMNTLNPVLRVGFQITERLLLEPGVGKKEASRRAEDLVERVGLAREVVQRYPHELSGGMKQRVGIAMALVMSPQVLILDEPTSALDVSVQAQVMNLLKQLKRDAGLAMLFITHDIALASDLCDRILVAYGGQLVEQGSADSVLPGPKHPYTQKLIASIPRLHGANKPDFLSGTSPDLVSPPSGCRFRERCPHAFEPCESKDPPAIKVGKEHTARCWLYQSDPVAAGEKTAR